ncbi:MAG: sugar phosphate nucleotidyltransferase [Microcoleaceae cyanobacterium]
MNSNKNLVKKAIIPAAGFGTRMFPASQGMKKEFFPVIDTDGRAKPIILVIVEEAIAAGIEEIGIVIQQGDKALFESFFKQPPIPELWQKLSAEKQEYSQYLQGIGQKITFLIQHQQEGYGHAVFCAKEWVKDEAFLLMLGDHIYRSHLNMNCTAQLLQIYQQVNHSVMGLRKTLGDQIHHYGCVAGDFNPSGDFLSITQIYEKPTLDYARTNLQVEGMAKDEFLSIFGLYILDSRIFDILQEEIEENQRDKGEFQLTSCLEKLRQQERMTGVCIQGECFDTGIPEAYYESFLRFCKS